MSHDSKIEAALALHRFGLGPRPGSITTLASDPRGALLAELERPGIGRIDNHQLMTSAQASRAAFEARAERQARQIVSMRAQKEAEKRQAEGMADAMTQTPGVATAAPRAKAEEGPKIERQI